MTALRYDINLKLLCHRSYILKVKSKFWVRKQLLKIVCTINSFYCSSNRMACNVYPHLQNMQNINPWKKFGILVYQHTLILEKPP